MIQQLDHASWLLSDAYPRLSAEATGNASREDLEWAVSVSALLQPIPSIFGQFIAPATEYSPHLW